MANSPQAKKRAQQNIKLNQHNSSLRSAMRTSIKKILIAINKSDKEAAKSHFKQAVAIIDSLAGKKLIHANKAARLKSRLNSKLKTERLHQSLKDQ